MGRALKGGPRLPKGINMSVLSALALCLSVDKDMFILSLWYSSLPLCLQSCGNVPVVQRSKILAHEKEPLLLTLHLSSGMTHYRTRQLKEIWLKPKAHFVAGLVGFPYPRLSKAGQIRDGPDARAH